MTTLNHPKLLITPQFKLNYGLVVEVGQGVYVAGIGVSSVEVPEGSGDGLS